MGNCKPALRCLGLMKHSEAEPSIYGPGLIRPCSSAIFGRQSFNVIMSLLIYIRCHVCIDEDFMWFRVRQPVGSGGWMG